MDTPSLAALAEELKLLRLPHFSYQTVWELGQALRATAAARAAPVAIQIRQGGELVFLTLLDGATADNVEWGRRKCASVQRFQRSSLALRLEAEAQGIDFNQRYRLAPDDYVASGGGFPLLLAAGGMIGTIAVSGLPNVEDHVLITDTLRHFLGVA